MSKKACSKALGSNFIKVFATLTIGFSVFSASILSDQYTKIAKKQETVSPTLLLLAIVFNYVSVFFMIFVFLHLLQALSGEYDHLEKYSEPETPVAEETEDAEDVEEEVGARTTEELIRERERIDLAFMPENNPVPQRIVYQDKERRKRAKQSILEINSAHHFLQ